MSGTHGTETTAGPVLGSPDDPVPPEATSTTGEPGDNSAGMAAVGEVARSVLPATGVIDDPTELRTYECDGLAHYRVTPALVVLPETTEQLAAVVRACSEHGVPFFALPSRSDMMRAAVAAMCGSGSVNSSTP